MQGGFPALVQTLMETRGTVEPILYDHDAVQWENFMHKSGRAQLYRHYRSTSSFAANFGLDLFHNDEPQSDITRDMLTEQEQYQRTCSGYLCKCSLFQIYQQELTKSMYVFGLACEWVFDVAVALLRAEQLGHTHVAELIRAKIEKAAAAAQQNSA